MAYGFFPIAAASIGLVLTGGWATPVQAAERARITQLIDADFGQLTSLSDVALAQSICVFSSSASGVYTVTAAGNGAGGAFELGSGSSTLAYEVQWASSAGQSSGSNLQPGVPSAQFTSIASQQFCNNGPPSSATLIIRLPGSNTANARAGAYSGVLSITIAPG